MRHTLPLAPQFYVTAPQPCPYLEGRMERKLFTALGGEHAQELNDALSKQGFRRSQNVLYRPSCVECSACLSARIRVADFRPDRTMRRVAKRNAGLERKVLAPRATREQFLLFRRYLDRRHAQGGMADMSEGEFAAMIEETPVRTRIVEYRSPPGEAGEDGPGARNGRQARGMPGASPEAPQGAPRGTSRAASGAARQDTSRGAPPEPSPDAPWGAAWTERRGALQAVCLTDVLDDGLSMVYSFFRPEEAARSLGTQVILDHVALAREAGLPYLYLGYWVPGSPQMGYKARFSALELFVGGTWQPIGDPAGYSSALHPLSTDPIAEQVARIALPDIQPGR